MALAAWDLAGHLPLPLGVAGHEGSTVIVGLNGLRLLRGSAWRKALNEGQTLWAGGRESPRTARVDGNRVEFRHGATSRSSKTLEL